MRNVREEIIDGVWKFLEDPGFQPNIVGKEFADSPLGQQLQAEFSKVKFSHFWIIRDRK